MALPYPKGLTSQDSPDTPTQKPHPLLCPAQHLCPHVPPVWKAWPSGHSSQSRTGEKACLHTWMCFFFSSHNFFLSCAPSPTWPAYLSLHGKDILAENRLFPFKNLGLKAFSWWRTVISKEEYTKQTLRRKY